MAHFLNGRSSGIIERMNRQKLGMIQILSLGFESVVRALWLLVIPVVLDLFFWLGPQLSVRTLFDRLVLTLARQDVSTPELRQILLEGRSSLTVVGKSLNLFALLATNFMGLRVLPVPSLKGFEPPLAAVPGAAPVAVSNVPVLPVDNVLLAVLLAIVLLVIGLLVGSLYLTLIADRVRLAGAPARPLPLRVLMIWLRIVVFVVALALFYLVAAVPFSIVVAIGMAINISLGLVLVVGGWLLSFWLLLYLWFTVYAMVIDGVGILRAMWYSANVVQRNLLSTFLLILLSNLIASGMVVLWQIFEGSWYGDLLAIAGNAFIGSGLVAAAFVFYQDRLRAWREGAAAGKLTAARRA